MAHVEIIGQTAKLLEERQAPAAVIKVLANRVAAVVRVNKGISIEQLANTLPYSGASQEKWDEAVEKLAEAARNVYQGKRIRL